MAVEFKDHDKLKKDLMKMYKNGSGNDVKIILMDGELDVNKDLLIARSWYFSTMLSNFVEGQTNTVEMKDVEKAHMDMFLKYLFTGELKLADADLEIHLELMNLSRLLDDVVEDVLQNAVFEALSVSNSGSKYLQSGKLKGDRFVEVFSLFKKSVDFKFDKIATQALALINTVLRERLEAEDEEITHVLQSLNVEQVQRIMDCEEKIDASTKSRVFKIWYDDNSGKLSNEDKIKYLEYSAEATSRKLDPLPSPPLRKPCESCPSRYNYQLTLMYYGNSCGHQQAFR